MSDVGDAMAPLVLEAGQTAAVVGFGVTGRAVTRALLGRGLTPIVIDDRPDDAGRAAAAELGIDLVEAPEAPQLTRLIAGADMVLPTPGLPDAHPAFAAARLARTPVLGEFDLARQWDDRPIAAITGTNGKTTVTTMVTGMLIASGRVAAAVGNTEIPLVEAIDDPATEVFVVEASSFRLGHTQQFRPRVGTWLNFDPDHLDVHSSLEAYEAAKARIWRDQRDDDVAVANADDPVVMRNLRGPACPATFGLHSGSHRVVDGMLVVHGAPLLAVAELARALPHDVTNALASALTALAVGADRDAVAGVLREFRPLAHRLELVGTAADVSWYDDSKATTPHAVLAALSGFDPVVLIAGGRNKGVDLGRLADAADRLRAVVAIGDAADEVAAAFAATDVPVHPAADMAAAVRLAAGAAVPGDTVILSPACASFDWYRNYAERGDDFAALVRALVLEAS